LLQIVKIPEPFWFKDREPSNQGGLTMVTTDALAQALLDFIGFLPLFKMIELMQTLRGYLHALPESLAIAILTFVMLIVFSFISLK